MREHKRTSVWNLKYSNRQHVVKSLFFTRIEMKRIRWLIWLWQFSSHLSVHLFGVFENGNDITNHSNAEVHHDIFTEVHQHVLLDSAAEARYKRGKCSFTRQMKNKGSSKKEKPTNTTKGKYTEWVVIYFSECNRTIWRTVRLNYLLSTKETAYVTARPGGIPASLKNWIHSEVA